MEKPSQALMPSSMASSETSVQVIQDGKQIARSFLKAFRAVGGKLGETPDEIRINAVFIGRYIENQGLSARDLEEALQHAYENNSYLTWGSVIKSLNELRSRIDWSNIRGAYAGQ